MVSNEDHSVRSNIVVKGPSAESSKHLSGVSSGGAPAASDSGGALGRPISPDLKSPNLAGPSSPKESFTTLDSPPLSQGAILLESPKSEVRRPFLAVYVAFSMPLPASILKAMIGHINTLLMVSDM